MLLLPAQSTLLHRFGAERYPILAHTFSGKMVSQVRTCLWSTMLPLLSLGVLSRGACTTKFFPLPAAT
ncbi:hypothetical protein F751_1645 [Auxenochlorella protothecoides]|uniref:Uncharacterized protein n=1 Tax=Auxenochlorella protothecoides TaxID=3075 RepID=A0A087SU65_AUXPR|nr:hypothetical protein F751_1645 [Auxenochlorella protothecoides]KFM29269.1 hypothetical protein F751_1645 [Auxenochlorella protothecoides]